MIIAFFLALANLKSRGQAPLSGPSVTSAYETAISALFKEKSNLAYFYFLESSRNHEPFVILIPDSIPLPSTWRAQFGVLPLHYQELCGVVKKHSPMTVVRFHLSDSEVENELRVTVAEFKYCKLDANRCIEKVFPKPIGATSDDFELTLMWIPKDGTYKYCKPRF